MATIASMIAMPEYSPKCEFLVENLFTPAYEKTNSELLSKIVGLESPWYITFFPTYVTKPFP